MFIPEFEVGENIKYKNWSKLLDSAFSIADYDTIVAHSMGSRVAIDSIIRNRYSVDRLILVSPAISSSRPEIASFYKEMQEQMSDIKEFVNEIIILHSKDDSVHTIEQSKEFTEMV